MKILSIISSAKHTGPGAPALSQATLLKQAGHTVNLILEPGGTLESEAEKAGIVTLSCLELPRNGQVWKILSDGRTLKNLVAREGYNLVIVHRSAEMFTAGVYLKGTVPVLRVWHDSSGRKASFFIRLFMNLYGVKGAATTPIGALALGSAGLNPEGRPRVLPAYVDTKLYSPKRKNNSFRNEQGLSNDSIVFGLAARWKPGRGHEALLHALSKAVKQNPVIKALLIGRGEIESHLQQIINDLDLKESVVLCNPGDRFVEALAACDCGVLMAPGSDGQARTGLEFMAMGKPLLVMNRGTLPYLTQISDPSGALLCENTKELTQKISMLSDDNDFRTSTGQQALKGIRNHHSIESVEPIVSNIITELCK